MFSTNLLPPTNLLPAIPAGEFYPEKIEGSFIDFSDSDESFSKKITEFSEKPEIKRSAWSPARTAAPNSLSTKISTLYKKNSKRKRITSPRTGEQWKSKKVPIAMSMLILSDSKQGLPIKLIGEGKVHRVYEFTCPNEKININNKTFSTESVALKILHPQNVAPAERSHLINQSNSVYQKMQSDGVPVAKTHIDPTQFTGESKDGMFWIVDKMETAITGDGWKKGSYKDLSEQDKSILSWAKTWFTKMSNEKKELISDFRIANTMLDKDRNPIVIDTSALDTTPEAFEFHLNSYLKDWSKGNENILKFLKDDFKMESTNSTTSTESQDFLI